MPQNIPVITIDGPSASGKSSVSRALAAKLGWKWVSTGAFYRGLAYVAMKERFTSRDVKQLIELTRSDLWRVSMDDDQTRVYYKGKDITPQILAEENAQRASQVSQVAEVRAALLQNQRDCAAGVKGLVAEGRDCGTVVFPQAVLKVYLTASQEERAARRAKEQGLNIEVTQHQQIQRDLQDTNRSAAPLQIPENAKIVDSNEMDLSQVVSRIYGWAIEVLGN